MISDLKFFLQKNMALAGTECSFDDLSLDDP